MNEQAAILYQSTKRDVKNRNCEKPEDIVIGVMGDVMVQVMFVDPCPKPAK